MTLMKLHSCLIYACQGNMFLINVLVLAMLVIVLRLIVHYFYTRAHRAHSAQVKCNTLDRE